MRKMRSLYILILMVAPLVAKSAQPVDSLKIQLAKEGISDQEKITLLLALSKKYVNTIPDSALYFVEQGRQLIKNKLSAQTRLQWWVHEGGVLIKNRKLTEAEIVLVKAIEAEEIENFPEIKGKAYVNLATVYLNLQAFDKSLELFIQALSLIEGNTALEIKAFNNMGILYSRLGDFDKASIHLEKALQLNNLDDAIKLSTLLNLAGLYVEKKNYQEAISTSLKASKLAEKFKHFPAMAVLYSNLSNVYNNTQEFEKSLSYALKGLSIKEQYQLPGKVFSLNNVGYAHFLLKNYQEAISYYKKGLPLAVGKERLGLLLNIKNAYAKAGDLSSALNYFDSYTMLKDSLDALDYKAKVAEIDTKYETEKKEYQINLLSIKNENQLAALERKNQLIAGIVIIGLLILGFIYLLYHQNKIKQRFEKAVLQQRLLRMQLNPHFLFNALNSIQTYLLEHKAEKSVNYLSSFARLMRFILEKAEEEWVSLEEEVEMLEHYLRLQQLNFNHSFSYNINVAEEFKEIDLMVPAMLTQPFLENAVIHGLPQLQDGEVRLNYTKKEDGLLIQISDNGNGHINTKNEANKLHNSISTDLINRRLIHLQKTNKQKVFLEFLPLNRNVDRPGTLVNIYLPLVYKGI